MIITITVFVVALLFLLSCQNSRSGEINWGILGSGIVVLCLGACLALNSMAGLDSDMKGLLLAGLGVIGGGLVVWAMVSAFSTSSPVSENWGEYVLFGWYKWDDYAEILVWALIIVVGSAAYLYTHSQHSLYIIDKNSRYSAALAEIHAQDRALAAAKAKSAVKVHHIAKAIHKH